MKITHVIRGEDHISNTPKQILLYEALDEKLPVFAHVSMILASDRSKLSKRHGATAVSEFISNGYLPEAFCNFLSLLGWSPKDEEEVGTLEHFATQFNLSRISQSPAIFDMEKLNWLNGIYIRQLPLDELLNRARPFLSQFNLEKYSDKELENLLKIVREPITTLSQLPESVVYFFEDVSYDNDIAKDVLSQEDTRLVLTQFYNDILPNLDFESHDSIFSGIKDFAKSLKPMKMKTVMWALRVATTGRVQGADLGSTLHILGKDTVTSRVDQALKSIAASVSS